MNETRHTPGAMRAAEKILRHKLPDGTTIHLSQDCESLAHIIEEETGLSDLLEAVKALVESDLDKQIEQMPYPEKVQFRRDFYVLEMAIAKAERGKS